MKNVIEFKETPLFESFTSEEQIAQLESMMESKDFDGKSIIIAVPTYDESHRNIEIEDKALFVTQKKDAEKMAHHIMETTSADLVRIVTDVDAIDDAVDFANAKTDVLILLHEFLDFEIAQLIEALSEKNTDLKILEIA